jgi:hypothetical protein
VRGAGFIETSTVLDIDLVDTSSSHHDEIFLESPRKRAWLSMVAKMDY